MLFQQILTSYPESDKIDDAAYRLADMYEGKSYKQYRRAEVYYERCFQWNPNTQFDVASTINGTTNLTLHYSRKDGTLAFFPYVLTRGF